MNVAPGGAYSSRLSLGPVQSGLVGTIRYRLIDNDAIVDDPVYGPSIVGVIEDPTGSGVYLFRGTAPLTAGVFNPAWDTGPGTELFFDDALVVTASAATPVVPGGHDYITLAQLKESLEMMSFSFADDDMIMAISSASRTVDYLCNRHFWNDNAPSTRSYVPRWSRVAIDDLIEMDTIDAETTSSTTTLVDGTDFVLWPLNAAADGKPYEAVQFLAGGATPLLGLPSLTVTGTYGWPAIPATVVTATTILASRFLRRQREAPFGVVTIGIEQGAIARISSTDPDVQNMLCDYVKESVFIALA